MDERANFLKNMAAGLKLSMRRAGAISRKTTVIDYFNHSLFNNVLSVYNRALAEERQRPLTTRRYVMERSGILITSGWIKSRDAFYCKDKQRIMMSISVLGIGDNVDGRSTCIHQRLRRYAAGLSMRN